MSHVQGGEYEHGCLLSPCHDLHAEEEGAGLLRCNICNRFHESGIPIVESINSELEMVFHSLNMEQEIFDAIYSMEEHQTVVIQLYGERYYVNMSSQSRYVLSADKKAIRVFKNSKHNLEVNAKLRKVFIKTDDEFDELIERMFGNGQGFLVGIEENPGPKMEHSINVGWSMFRTEISDAISSKQFKEWAKQFEKCLTKLMNCKTVRELEYKRVALSFAKTARTREQKILTNIILSGSSMKMSQMLHRSLRDWSKSNVIYYFVLTKEEIKHVSFVTQIPKVQSQMFRGLFQVVSDSSEEDDEPAMGFMDMIRGAYEGLQAMAKLGKIVSVISNGFSDLYNFIASLYEKIRKIIDAIYEPFLKLGKALCILIVLIMLIYWCKVTAKVARHVISMLEPEEDEFEMLAESQLGGVGSFVSILLYAMGLATGGSFSVDKAIAFINTSITACTKLGELQPVQYLSTLIEPFVKYVFSEVLGVDWLDGESPEHIIKEWLKSVSDLLSEPNMAKLLTQSKEFRAHALKICERHDEILGLMASYKVQAPPNMSMLLNALMALKKKVLAIEMRESERVEPVTIYAAGPPGKGKTVFIQFLFSMIFSTDLTLEQAEDPFSTSLHIYTKSKESPYWEGYAKQPFVFLNDVLMGSAPADCVQEAKDMMGITEGGVYALNMAFEGKGTTYFTTPYVAITSNRKDFRNIGTISPEAMARRMTFPIYIEWLGIDYDPAANDGLGNLDECYEIYPLYIEGAGTWLNDRFDLVEYPVITTTGGFKIYQAKMKPSVLLHVILECREEKLEKHRMFKNGITRAFGEFLLNSRPQKGFRLHPEEEEEEMPPPPKQKWVLKKPAESVQLELEESEEDLFDMTGTHRAAGTGLKRIASSESQMLATKKVPKNDLIKTSFLAFFEKTKKDVEEQMEEMKQEITSTAEKVVMESKVVLEKLDPKVATTEELINAPERVVDIGSPVQHLLLEGTLVCKMDVITTNFSLHFITIRDKSYTWYKDNVWSVEFGDTEAILTQTAVPLSYVHLIPISTEKITNFQWLRKGICDGFVNILRKIQEGVTKAFRGMVDWLDSGAKVLIEGFVKKVIDGSSYISIIGYVSIAALVTATIVSAIVKIVKLTVEAVLPQAEETLEEQDLQDYVASQSRQKMDKMPARKTINTRYAKRSQIDTGYEEMLRFMNNSRIVTITNEDGGEFETNILMITDKVGFLVSHAFKLGKLSTITIYDMGGQSPQTYNRKQLSVHHYQNRDLTRIIFSVPISHVKSYKHALRSRDEEQKIIMKPIRLIKGLQNGRLSSFVTQGDKIEHKSDQESAVLITETGEFIETKFSDYYLMFNGGGFAGACGFPVRTAVSSSSNTKWLLGIHIGQVGADSLVSPIYAEDMTGFAESQTYIPRAHLYDQIDHKGIKDSVVTGVAPKFLGRPAGLSNKSKLVSTNMTRELEQIFEVPIDKPADLSAEAYGNALKKYDQKVTDRAMPERLDQLIKDDPEVIFALLENRTQIELFDFDWKDESVRHNLIRIACLGGTVTDKNGKQLYMDSSDCSTAAGPPDNGKKSQYWNLEKQTISEDFVMEVDQLLQAALRGEHVMQQVNDSLKDETRPEDRVRDKKTRLFCSASTHFCIAQKVVYYPIVKHFVAHRAYYPIQCGMNVHSAEWEFARRRVSQFRNVIGGDQSGQDITIPKMFIYYMLSFLKHKFRAAGDWALLLEGIGFGVSSTIHHNPKYTYTYDRGNASGNWLTSFYSSFSTLLAISYVFVSGCLDRNIEVTKDVFKNNVSLLVFGDDNLGSVSDEFAWFDCKFIKKQMNTLFGMEYTSPSKGDFEQEFLGKEEVEFLCRKFAIGDLVSLGYTKAPLSPGSIAGMLSYVKQPKPYESIDSKLLEVKSSVELELCHRVPAESDALQEKLNSLMKSKNYTVRFDWRMYAARVFQQSYLS